MDKAELIEKLEDWYERCGVVFEKCRIISPQSFPIAISTFDKSPLDAGIYYTHAFELDATESVNKLFRLFEEILTEAKATE